MKKYRAIILSILLMVPTVVYAANDITFSEDTTFELTTTDTSSEETMLVSSGSTVTSLDVQTDQIDITLDNGSDITFENSLDSDYYFVLNLVSGSGATYDDCPTDSVQITSTNTAVVRLTIVGTDPACGTPPSNIGGGGGGATNSGGGGGGSGSSQTNNNDSDDENEDNDEEDNEESENQENEKSTNNVDGSATPFNDISNHWGQSYIEDLYKKGIIQGRTKTSFEPNAEINRAEAIKLSILLFGHDTDDDEAENPFVDIKEGDWFYNYVITAKKNSIIEGYSDSTFRPGQYITRAEAVTIILKSNKIELESGESPFIDTIKHWGQQYIFTAHKLGLIKGYPDGNFRPDSYITRAEFAKILNLANKLKK